MKNIVNINDSKKKGSIFCLPDRNFVDKVQSLIHNYLEKNGYFMKCEDLTLTSDEMSSPTGFLPIIMWRSREPLKKIWGDQNLVFECSEESLCGVKPSFSAPMLPLSIWLHSIHYQMDSELKTFYLDKENKNSPFPLEKWINEWYEDLNVGKVNLLSPTQIPSSQPSNIQPLSG